MGLYTGLIVSIVGGFLFLVLILLCTTGKSLLDNYLENTEIIVDQESQETTQSQMFGQRHISIIQTISLPSYENAITCQKVETPPPKYLELFFPTKSSPPLDPISEV